MVVTLEIVGSKTLTSIAGLYDWTGTSGLNGIGKIMSACMSSCMTVTWE